MSKEIVKKPIDKLKSIVNSESVKMQFQNALGKHSDLFTASIISLYASDDYLQNCEPGQVVQQALKAAILKLPIDKNLGFAYIIPYKNNKTKKLEPNFQLGYKGKIQLAMRTGQIKTINDGPIFDGEVVTVDRITGKVKISGEKKSNKAIGYFAYFELTNGYQKVEYWTKEEVTDHAKRYSQAFKSNSKIWVTEFDKMASKTVLSHILDKYAPKSIEFLMVDRPDDLDDEQEKPEVIQIENLIKPEIENRTKAKDDDFYDESGPDFGE